jgi:hypothetical protein
VFPYCGDVAIPGKSPVEMEPQVFDCIHLGDAGLVEEKWGTDSPS